VCTVLQTSNRAGTPGRIRQGGGSIATARDGTVGLYSQFLEGVARIGFAAEGTYDPPPLPAAGFPSTHGREISRGCCA